MQCVTCKKSSLFPQDYKHKKYILVEQEKYPNFLEMKDINSFLYEIEA
jgi:hypothetical protein